MQSKKNSTEDRPKNIRARFLDFLASMNIVNRFAWSMIIRHANCAKNKTQLEHKDYSPLSNPKTVAIVVPIYKTELTADEQISLKHLLHFLKRYDKYMVIPKGLKVNLPDFNVKEFPADFFKNTQTYNKLMLSKDFYETFKEYEYILIYQLDSLVFLDGLVYWCRQGYDYIGAPWITEEKVVNSTIYASGSNGGFSLRKIDSFLKVIERAKNCISAYEENEDRFWSIDAVKHCPGFKVPSAEVAVKFSFELSPRFCFEITNQMLPFGCHAWAKYDRDFWEPYLLKLT